MCERERETVLTFHIISVQPLSSGTDPGHFYIISFSESPLLLNIFPTIYYPANSPKLREFHALKLTEFFLLLSVFWHRGGLTLFLCIPRPVKIGFMDSCETFVTTMENALYRNLE